MLLEACLRPRMWRRSMLSMASMGRHRKIGSTMRHIGCIVLANTISEMIVRVELGRVIAMVWSATEQRTTVLKKNWLEASSAQIRCLAILYMELQSYASVQKGPSVQPSRIALKG